MFSRKKPRKTNEVILVKEKEGVEKVKEMLCRD